MLACELDEQRAARSADRVDAGGVSGDRESCRRAWAAARGRAVAPARSTCSPVPRPTATASSVASKAAGTTGSPPGRLGPSTTTRSPGVEERLPDEARVASIAPLVTTSSSSARAAAFGSASIRSANAGRRRGPQAPRVGRVLGTRPPLPSQRTHRAVPRHAQRGKRRGIRENRPRTRSCPGTPEEPEDGGDPLADVAMRASRVQRLPAIGLRRHRPRNRCYRAGAVTN